VVHQFLGARQGDILETADQSPGGASGFGRLLHEDGCFTAAFAGNGMGRENNSIAGFDCHQRLCHHCRGGVRAGGQRANHTHWPGNLVNVPGGIVTNDADCADILDTFPDGFGTKFILQFFMERNAIAGFFDCHSAKPFCCLIASLSHCCADAVNLFL